MEREKERESMGFGIRRRRKIFSWNYTNKIIRKKVNKVQTFKKKNIPRRMTNFHSFLELFQNKHRELITIVFYKRKRKREIFGVGG